jgi:hypothetical protein
MYSTQSYGGTILIPTNKEHLSSISYTSQTFFLEKLSKEDKTVLANIQPLPLKEDIITILNETASPHNKPIKNRRIQLTKATCPQHLVQSPIHNRSNSPKDIMNKVIHLCDKDVHTQSKYLYIESSSQPKRTINTSTNDYSYSFAMPLKTNNDDVVTTHAPLHSYYSYQRDMTFSPNKHYHSRTLTLTEPTYKRMQHVDNNNNNNIRYSTSPGVVSSNTHTHTHMHMHMRNKAITLSSSSNNMNNNNQYRSCYTDSSVVSEENANNANYECVINLSKRDMLIARYNQKHKPITCLLCGINRFKYIKMFALSYRRLILIAMIVNQTMRIKKKNSDEYYKYVINSWKCMMQQQHVVQRSSKAIQLQLQQPQVMNVKFTKSTNIPQRKLQYREKRISFQKQQQ